MNNTKNNSPNKKLYYLLGEMNGKLDGLITSQSKTIYALIALAGATIGLKLVGSPPLQVILFYTKIFLFLFTIIIALMKRRIFGGWYYIFAFGVFAGAAQIVNVFSNSSEPIISTSLFLLSNLALALFIWNWDKWNKK